MLKSQLKHRIFIEIGMMRHGNSRNSFFLQAMHETKYPYLSMLHAI